MNVKKVGKTWEYAIKYNKNLPMKKELKTNKKLLLL